MRIRSVSIKADTEESALVQAERNLQVSADEIVLFSKPKGFFEATLKQDDAEIDISISRDGMTVEIEDYQAALGSGLRLNKEKILEFLDDAEVRMTPDEEAVSQVLQCEANGESPVGIVLVRGIPSQAGEDGRVELEIETNLNEGTFDEDGRIDFRERGLNHSAYRGQFLGRIYLPVKGKAGTDVGNNPIPSKDGVPAVLKVGDNVESTSNEELNANDLFSKINGIVKLAHNELSISEVLEISGDVDFSTGNIRMSDGSIKVRGIVKSGFSCQAAGNIIVEKSIENADVVAGGDVTVRRGILNGRVTSRNAVFAQFARNANIEADGSVEIDKSLYNCRVRAGDSVIVTKGRGLIRGGVIRADSVVEANEIGSNLSSTTRIIAGLEQTMHSDLMKEKARLEQIIEALELVLGQGDAETLIKRAPPEKQTEVAQAVRAFGQLKRLEKVIERQEKKFRQQADAKIIVYKKIYSGTHITIAGKSLDIPHAITASQFFLNVEEDQIQWVSLK